MHEYIHLLIMVKRRRKTTGHLVTDHHSYFYLSEVLLYLILQISDS